MAGYDRVLVYIGAPKTGTTSVQAFLWDNRAALMNLGFYIPTSGRGIGQHIELAVAVHAGLPRPGIDRHTGPADENLETRRSKFLLGLDQELSVAPRCHTLLFFSEYMFSSNRAEVRAYRRFFSRFSSRMDSVMYLRRQDQWLASLTLQSRKSGTRNNLELLPGAPDRYGGAIRSWDAESDACHIRRFDQEFLTRGNIITDFCEVIGADTSSLSTAEVRSNPSIFQEQLELVDTFNKRLERMPFSRRIHYRRRFVSLCIETLSGTRIEFPKDAALAAFASFERINGWLRDTRDPEGPELFFNTDFSGYAEKPDNERRYTIEQLERLVSTIMDLRRERGQRVRDPVDGGSREALINKIASSFISLRRSELDEQRTANRAARRARQDATAGVDG